MTTGRTDMYGTQEQEAVSTLQAFLREDLQEPQAEIEGLDIVDGHWQGNVVNSERGIRMVFLREHNGKLAPGHATEDYHLENKLDKG